MADLGLFGNALFGEALFNNISPASDKICLFAVGDSAIDGRATAIHSAQLIVMGDSVVNGRATAIHSARLTVVGDSEIYGVGKRIRYFPALSGLAVKRWDNKR